MRISRHDRPHDKATCDQPDDVPLDYLSEQRDRILQWFAVRGKRWDRDGVRDAYLKLDTVIHIFRIVQEHFRRPAPLPTYLMDSQFLLEAFRFVTRCNDEELVYVTGPEGEEDVFALSRLVPVRLAQRSLAHAKAELGSQLQVLTKLDEDGYRLLACFHSHPGRGQEATTPSSVDRQMQANLEQGGYVAIGGIFSRDGHVRFFSHKRAFRVLVTGSGAVLVGSKLYRLETDPSLICQEDESL